ncbi:8-amino-7-oxononanoate synthase [Bacillus ectoiniformans]|uniref:8-amino-7-oxononanoate synthase n=1 Tax=Bacillus ectoiniformans TaxID=1494429 RepID=UPI001EF9855C|nr:8-amino-7-oxononanoate synthase [Bacillus ectoiniformans]MBM7647363.1 8-amino-7-oxononanoate synthase [Bacillus ectoiniformans]
MFNLEKELKELDKLHLRRKVRKLDSPSEPEVILEGNPVRLFSTNNYLGLSTHPELKKQAIQAIDVYGTGSGGSRLTTGNFSIHEQLEQKIAEWKKTESALLFSSGYLANIGTISALMGKGDYILSDELNHASIIDGCRLSKATTVIYRHTDVLDLEQKLTALPRHSKKLIVTDGVFSMDGNLAPLPDIVNLAKAYGAWVMVDDAHATGVLGKHGRGTAEFFGIETGIQIQVGTLSKAIGTEGGFVAASHDIVEYLKNRSRPFIFQTSLSPGVVGASIAAIDILQREPERRERLLSLSSSFRSGLLKHGFQLVPGQTPIIALLVGEAEKALHFSKLLEERGIFAPAIRPPTVPVGKSRIRFTIMATHSDEQLTEAIHEICRTGDELGICPLHMDI